MLGDSLWTGMTIESSGVIERDEALYSETVPSFDPLSRALGGVAALLGMVAAAVYWSAGLSLSHYDEIGRAHV